MKLKVSTDLSLPLDAVTQKMAAIGRTGSGKSYFATKLAEEMLNAGAQIVCLDVVGIWWGLRLDADGKTPGLSIPVFGGLHGDIPLEPTAGKLIADLIIDKGISVVLDVSQFESDADKSRFATDFGDRFFFRKKSSPSAVHVFLEECQEIIPQNIQRGEERMLHSWQRLIRLGRNFGIGATLITQRPQDVNKKALNQAECVFAFQLTGPQERKAIDIWMSDKGLDLDLASDLPKLSIGEAHVWSPAWLKKSETVTIDKKKTFNASSTPEVGRRSKSHDLAKIDLESIHEQMKATIEKAKANDPNELKKKISELEKQLKAQPKSVDSKESDGLKLKLKEREGTIRSLIKARDILFDSFDKVKRIVDALPSKEKIIMERDIHGVMLDTRVVFNKGVAKVPQKHISTLMLHPMNADQVTIGRCEREIVKFLAMRQGKFFNKTQIGVMTGYSANSGGFNNALSKLNTIGYIAKVGSDVGINEDKIQEIIEFLGSDYNGSDQNSLEQWLSKLGKCEREIYQLVLNNPDDAYSKEKIGETTGYSSNSGGFNNAISRLNTLGLIERNNGMIKLNHELLEV